MLEPKGYRALGVVAQELLSRRIASAEREAGVPPGGFTLVPIEIRGSGGRQSWPHATLEMLRGWIADVWAAFEGRDVYIVMESGRVVRAAPEIMDHNEADGMNVDLLRGLVVDGVCEGRQLVITEEVAAALLGEWPDGWHGWTLVEKARHLLRHDSSLSKRDIAQRLAVPEAKVTEAIRNYPEFARLSRRGRPPGNSRNS